MYIKHDIASTIQSTNPKIKKRQHNDDYILAMVGLLVEKHDKCPKKRGKNNITIS